MKIYFLENTLLFIAPSPTDTGAWARYITTKPQHLLRGVRSNFWHLRGGCAASSWIQSSREHLTTAGFIWFSWNVAPRCKFPAQILGSPTIIRMKIASSWTRGTKSPSATCFALRMLVFLGWAVAAAAIRHKTIVTSKDNCFEVASIRYLF